MEGFGNISTAYATESDEASKSPGTICQEKAESLGAYVMGIMTESGTGRAFTCVQHHRSTCQMDYRAGRP